jgi:hypothetical protein
MRQREKRRLQPPFRREAASRPGLLAPSARPIRPGLDAVQSPRRGSGNGKDMVAGRSPALRPGLERNPPLAGITRNMLLLMQNIDGGLGMPPNAVNQVLLRTDF